MKLSERWLRTWVNPPITRDELSHQLTQAGLEVEAVTASENDAILEINLTPNRGDCLSIAGIAREVAAINRCDYNPLIISALKSKLDTTLSIDILEPKACPRYSGRVIRGVNPRITTPDWIQERLQAGGIRCISVIVDIANYVMLELGQPLHAFDLAKLAGPIQVRYAKIGESLQLLDEQTVKLDERTLIIADQQKPLAIAGVMGGLASAVTDYTTDILLESAFFSPQAIAGCARRYGLQTDAAYRFERGVAPDLPARAIERVSELIVSIAGGQAGEVVERVAVEHLPIAPSIDLRYPRIKRILGVEIAKEIVTDILLRLGMTLTTTAESWQIKVPNWRFDLKREIDLIEEVARIYGFANIPAQLPKAALAFSGIPQQRNLHKALAQQLVSQDYHQAITYSFIAADLQQLFEPELLPLSLANPLSAELAVMRTSLWPGLVSALRYNQNRQQEQVKLFELGKCFVAKGNELQQPLILAGVCSGNTYPEQWSQKSRSSDFFDLKGLVEQLLLQISKGEDFIFSPSEHPALQPGQRADIFWQGQLIGRLGMLHIRIQDHLELLNPAFIFELYLENIEIKPVLPYKNISKFPSIRRDLAILVKQTTSYQQVQDIIWQYAGSLLIHLQPFDIYQGKGIEPGYKSMALALYLQHPERTLVDEEVNAMIEMVLAELNKSIGASLRI